MSGVLNKIVKFGFKIWNRQLILGKNVIIDPRAFISRGGHILINDNSIIRAGAMLLPAGGSITIGKRCSINQYTIINGQGNVKIGDNVMIAAFVSIFAGNHNFSNIEIPMRDQGMTTKGGIIIENDVWIGTHSVILDGVKIGTGSIIAAGAVVINNVEPFSIIGGVPGKLIRRRN